MSDLKSIDLQLPSTCVQFKVPEFSPLLQACFSNLLSVKTEVTDAVGFYREGTGCCNRPVFQQDSLTLLCAFQNIRTHFYISQYLEEATALFILF